MNDKVKELLDKLLAGDELEDNTVFQSTIIDDTADGVVFVFNEKHKVPLYTLFRNLNSLLADVASAGVEQNRCILIGVGEMKGQEFNLQDKLLMSTSELLSENSEYVQ